MLPENVHKLRAAIHPTCFHLHHPNKEKIERCCCTFFRVLPLATPASSIEQCLFPRILDCIRHSCRAMQKPNSSFLLPPLFRRLPPFPSFALHPLPPPPLSLDLLFDSVHARAKRGRLWRRAHLQPKNRNCRRRQRKDVAVVADVVALEEGPMQRHP